MIEGGDIQILHIRMLYSVITLFSWQALKREDDFFFNDDMILCSFMVRGFYPTLRLDDVFQLYNEGILSIL